jgi:phage anti-repressor protein
MNNLKVIADEILPVYENEFGEKFVDARELHRVLLVGKDFTTWIKDRIDKYGFIEGEDFSPILVKTPNGRPRTEYILTLDTAKEIAMVQNNEMGRAVRKYFIEVEKRFRQQQPKTQAEMLLMYAQQMVEQERKVRQLEQQVNNVQHRLDNIDRIDTIGDLRQRLNKMIQRYAHQNGIPFNFAWKDFVQAFNTAYRTNLELRRQNYINKVGKDISRPQFLEEMGLLEDAIRVADKLLNSQKGA